MMKEKRRKEVAAMKSQFSAYSSDKSDLFTGINILGDFFENMMNTKKDQEIVDIQKEISNFSKEKFLQTKSMSEVYSNFNQLV